jgi:apolipoprotein N-acyltransferase
MKLGRKEFGLSLLSGILLSLAWYGGLSFLIFFAWVPLLYVEAFYQKNKEVSGQKLRFRLFSLTTFFVWNLLVTWWVAYASFGGACMAIICNSLLMCMVFALYSAIRTKLQKYWSAFLIIPVWLAWEHGHTLWDLTWTWLTLGNVFAFHPNWVQWYEFTGTSGGSAWALLVNCILLGCVLQEGVFQTKWKRFLIPFSLVLLPILISYLLIPRSNQTKEIKYNTVVVQPNIDPYNEKFAMDYQSQFLKTLSLIKPKITSETDYLVLPETFITDNINEAELDSSEAVRWFRDSLISKFPKLHIVTGCNSYVFYEKVSEITGTARKDESSGFYYDVFNTAIQITKTDVQIYHKSKLVPGVERMPFPALLKPLESLAINMGGTMGSLGTQNERSVLKHQDKKAVVAPVVCYESVYADYLTEYIRKGANLIFIITNDGWWEDTPGYIQHLNYARLRAIENRMCIARSANTGISCFIYPDGSIQQATSWWQADVIAAELNLGQPTFFSRFGDIISYLCTGICLVLLLLFHIIFPIKSKIFKNK